MSPSETLTTLAQTAGAFTLPDTGITHCYDAGGNIIPCPQPGQPLYGQDAQYGPGTMSFTVNGDGTVTDNNTGYMWELKAAADDVAQPADPGDADNLYTWAAAVDLVAQLNASGYKGYHDWRLPTAAELDTLFDLSISEPGPMIDTQVFSACRSGAYWTSDGNAEFPTQAWTLDFSTGEDSPLNKTDQAFVRLVRGGIQ